MFFLIILDYRTTILLHLQSQQIICSDPKQGSSKAINSQTTQRFLDDLPDSLHLPKDARVQKLVNHLTEELNVTLRNTLDAVAPLKTKNICHKKLAPWYTENTWALKQASRKLERKWRHTKLEVFRLAWKDSPVQYQRALNAAWSSYFSNLIEENKNNPKCIFDTDAKLTKKQHSPREDGFNFSSDKFMNFFDEKTPCCPQSTWICCCSSFNCSACGFGTCSPDVLSCPGPAVLDSVSNSEWSLWKANWHLLLRCWPVAPSTTTVIIIIWPCWSSMNIWTSWPCSLMISTQHSEKRTGHPS